MAVLSDRERIEAARTFFWEMCGKNETVVAVSTARSAIKRLAEALPPFTAVNVPDEAL